jgi:putative nucleotidyltransferase with HDIG domain
MASVAAAEAQTQAAYMGAIRALATALDARDPYTAGHSDRVAVLSVAMARTLALAPEAIEVIRLGALLHDIGKIGVPDDVLRKPGPLTEAEFACIKTHPVLGARILRAVPFLARHIPIVELHHERPNGPGYPNGLRGDDVPLAARVVHVADAYDAITSARVSQRAARIGGDEGNCGAARAPHSMPRSSAPWRPRCRASPSKEAAPSGSNPPVRSGVVLAFGVVTFAGCHGPLPRNRQRSSASDSKPPCPSINSPATERSIVPTSSST